MRTGRLDVVSRRRAILFSSAMTGAVVFSGCGPDSKQCVSSDIGEVCADDSDGSVRFSGDGLEPGSDVIVNHPEIGDSAFPVDSDGSFEPNGGGFLAFVAGTTITFTISAVDSDGTPIEGEITVTS